MWNCLIWLKKVYIPKFALILDNAFFSQLQYVKNKEEKISNGINKDRIWRQSHNTNDRKAILQ